MARPDQTDMVASRLDGDFIHGVVVAVAHAVTAHSDEFTTLDQAIGDGDHGINMKRGFEAVLAEADALARQSLPIALESAGMKLVMNVGGASGPLYGTLLMSLGKNISDDPTPKQLTEAFRTAIGDVMARGKSKPGEKTMLDVLVPVLLALDKGVYEPDQVAFEARSAAEQTIDMKAIRGRASYLGDRSIGHMDPGARSSTVIIETLCKFIKEHP